MPSFLADIDGFIITSNGKTSFMDFLTSYFNINRDKGVEIVHLMSLLVIVDGQALVMRLVDATTFGDFQMRLYNLLKRWNEMSAELMSSLGNWKTQ